MYCVQCGKEIPAGSPTCPACGFNAMPGARGGSGGTVSFDQAVRELRSAARDLARSARGFSKRVGAEAQKAADDPAGAARRAARKAAQELDHAASEVERVLRDL